MVKEMAVNKRDRLNSYTLKLSVCLSLCLNSSVILKRNEMCLEKNKKCLKRNETPLKRNEMRGGTELTLEWYCYWYFLKSNLKLFASPKDEISKRYEY